MGFEFNEQERVWMADDITELTSIRAENFLKYGQPYSPYEPEYSHNYAENFHTLTPTIRFSQREVMFDG